MMNKLWISRYVAYPNFVHFKIPDIYDFQDIPKINI